MSRNTRDVPEGTVRGSDVAGSIPAATRRGGDKVTALQGRLAPELGRLLESAYGRWHRLEEVERDPLRFPRRYADVPDREAVGFIAAAFAFGRVAAFLPVLETLFARLGPSPAATLAALHDVDALALSAGIGHRFARPPHVAGLLAGTGAVLRAEGSLRGPVLRAYRGGRSVTEGLRDLAAAVRAGTAHLDPGFLVPLEGRSGPLKRLHLFLRWMVRMDGIDLGAWPEISPSDLVIPMDVHVCRIARLLGLLPDRRSGPSLADAQVLTKALKTFDPADPVRFDFAMSHLGISGGCSGREGAACVACALAPACRRRD